jgi:glycosyltransferase involved in cell wall biosynthesis
MDVVHDHTTVGPIFAALRRPRTVVATNHGPFDDRFGLLYRNLPELPVIAISERQASTADGAHVVAVIHHGIDVDAIPVGRGDGGYASFLGRMSPDKGPREAALVARQAGVPLRMAAKIREPEEQEYFEAQVEPLLGGDVEYVGELGEQEKLELVGGSFALLNPIQWEEPFGLVMIEALATGTPVVATTSGSAPEIVEDGVTGYLRDGIADLACALLSAPGLDRRRCRAAAEGAFSTERMVAEHLRVYRQLAAGAPGTSRVSPAAAGGTAAFAPRPRAADRAEQPRPGSPPG